jgi:hypothetical protein
MRCKSKDPLYIFLIDKTAILDTIRQSKLSVRFHGHFITPKLAPHHAEGLVDPKSLEMKNCH